jgi:hypothetical protein
MGIAEKISIFLRKRRFQTHDIHFNGTLPLQSTMLVLLPENVARFSFCLPAIAALHRTTRGKAVFYGQESLQRNFKDVFRDMEFLPADPGMKSLKDLEHVDIIVDLSRPPSTFRDVPLFIDAKYRVTADGSAYPYYNVVIDLPEDRDDFLFLESFLKVLNVSQTNYNLNVRDASRTMAWDYLVFRGHRRENFLVFLDCENGKRRAIKDVLLDLLKGSCTFITTVPDEPGSISLSTMESEIILSAVSLSDLYVGGASMYVGPAFYLKVPILIVDREESVRLPHSTQCAEWITGEREDLETALRGLLRV